MPANRSASIKEKSCAEKVKDIDKKGGQNVTVTFKIQGAQHRINKVKDFMEALGIEYEVL